MPKGIYTRVPGVAKVPYADKYLNKSLKQIGVKRATQKGQSGTKPTKRRGRG